MDMTNKSVYKLSYKSSLLVQNKVLNGGVLSSN